MAISQRSFGLLVLGFLAAGCGSSDDLASPADLAGRCGHGWVEACEAAGCDPSNALWSECRINGWSGYRAPESCPVATGYPGDDDAPCAPKPDEGFQLRFGPADYADQAEIDKHLIPAGAQEIEGELLLPETGRSRGRAERDPADRRRHPRSSEIDRRGPARLRGAESAHDHPPPGPLARRGHALHRLGTPSRQLAWEQAVCRGKILPTSARSVEFGSMRLAIFCQPRQPVAESDGNSPLRRKPRLASPANARQSDAP